MTDGVRKGYFSRDSLEAADYQSDLYYTIRHPNAPLRAQPAVSAQKDTLETLQTKLEKEAQQQLLQGNYPLTSAGLLLAAKLAKFIFMALMLPPYLIAYSLPKFLLTKAIPSGLRLFFRPLVKFAQALTSAMQTTRLRLQKLASFFKMGQKKPAKQETAQLFKRLLNFCGSFYNSALNAALRPFRAAVRICRAMAGGAKTTIHHLMQRLKASLVAAASATKLRFLNQLIRLGSALQRAFIQPVVKWTAPKAQAMRTLFSKLSHRLSEGAGKMRGAVATFMKDPVQVLTNMGYALGQWFVQTASAISVPAVEWVAIKVTEVVAIMRDWRSQGYELVIDRYQLAKEQVKAWGDATAQAANILWNGIANIPQQLLQITPKISFAWLRRGGRWGRQKYRLAKEVCDSNLRKGVVALKAGVARGCGELNKWLKIGLEWLLKKLKALPYRLWLAAKRAGSLLLAGSKKLIYNLRIAMAWTKVLFRYGMELVREAAQEIMTALTAWFSR